VTSTTPANESPAAIQNRRASRSIPTRREMSAVKIGSVPKSSAAVVAVVRSSAKTKLSWLTSRSTTASATSGRSPRPIRSERSRGNVSATNTSAAAV
jgi:hypothetical protein